jgi:ribosome-binding factor A
MPPSIRVERVRELMKRELSEIIRREIPLSEVGLITVNDVEVSKDLQNATVYVGVVGTERQRQDALVRLGHSRKQLQASVGRAVVLKYTPLLRFVLDDSIQRGNRVLQILEELEGSPSRHEDASENH